MFTIQFTVALQLLCLFAQLVAPTIPGITPDWLRFVAAVVSFLQAAGALLAHHRNPDGTSARAAYEPTRKP